MNREQTNSTGQLKLLAHQRLIVRALTGPVRISVSQNIDQSINPPPDPRPLNQEITQPLWAQFLSLFKPALNMRVILNEPITFTAPDGSTVKRKVYSHWLKSPTDLGPLLRAWDGQGALYFCPQSVADGDQARSDTITNINALVLDLDFKLAGRTYEPEELLIRCKELGLPELGAIVATGGGYQAYQIFERPIYTGPRKGQPGPIRQEKLDRCAKWYSDTTRKMVKLFADLGADPKATDLPHIFRLPGAVNLKHDEIVTIPHLNAESQINLDDLSRTAGEALRKRRSEKLYTALRAVRPSTTTRAESKPSTAPAVTQHDTPSVTMSKPAPAVLKTAGYRWLRFSQFRIHNRNAAYFALGSILKMAGYDFGSAWAELTKWRRSQTRPTYPEAEATRVLKAIFKFSYGLTVEKLMDIQAESGASMSKPEAESLIYAMPTGHARHSERQNYPLLAHVGTILQYLINQHVTCDTPISAPLLAQATGLSIGQVNRVAGFLTEIGVRQVLRHGSSDTATYNLKRLRCPPHLVIDNFGRWRGYRVAFKLWLWRWWRKLRAMMKGLEQILCALGKLLNDTSIAEFWSGQVGAGRIADRSVQSRGPPAMGRAAELRTVGA